MEVALIFIAIAIFFTAVFLLLIPYVLVLYARFGKKKKEIESNQDFPKELAERKVKEEKNNIIFSKLLNMSPRDMFIMLANVILAFASIGGVLLAMSGGTQALFLEGFTIQKVSETTYIIEPIEK